jgi:hypothetical protein
MGDAGLDDDVGLGRVDRFLGAHHVVGQLDDGPAHPAEGIGIFAHPADIDPNPGDPLEALGREQVDLAAALISERPGSGIDGNLHGFAFMAPPPLAAEY